VIKSGGKTRRAAKMVILKSITRISGIIACKMKEERKPWSDPAGYDSSIDGDVVCFDSSRRESSVRVTDDFMRARW